MNAFQIVDGKLLLQYSKGVREKFNADPKGKFGQGGRQLAGVGGKKGEIGCKNPRGATTNPRTICNPWTKTQLVVSWMCRITAAVILCQTLFFKFTGAEESVYIFTKVGLEPWGRYGSGVAELIASILLLTPRFCWAGALLAMAVMGGAVASHLTVLGIEVKGDHGLLFGLALTVIATCGVTAFLHRGQIPCLHHHLKIRRA